MEYDENTSIFEYAKSLGCEKCISFYDVFSFLLKDFDCIVCRESAADLLGYSNGGFVKKISVYSTKDFNKPYLNCIVVDNLDNIPYENFKGIKTTPIEHAIVDMLTSEDTDSQVLFETHANYYCENHDSYDGLNIPLKLRKKAKFYQEQGAKYYDV